jgi:hypothetical protein
MRYGRVHIEQTSDGYRYVSTGPVVALFGFFAWCCLTLVLLAPTILAMAGLWELNHTTWLVYAVGVPLAVVNALAILAVKHAVTRPAPPLFEA